MSETEPLRPLGEVEIEEEIYEILEIAIEHYQVVRKSDARPVGVFRGTQSSMWLLEPQGVTLDLLRAIVRSAIVDGVIVEVPTD
jgi:hypothetical protein